MLLITCQLYYALNTTAWGKINIYYTYRKKLRQNLICARLARTQSLRFTQPYTTLHRTTSIIPFVYLLVSSPVMEQEYDFAPQRLFNQ